jgi:hypothetical protein
MRGLCVRRLSNLRPPFPPPRQALHLTFERLGCSAWRVKYIILPLQMVTR